MFWQYQLSTVSCDFVKFVSLFLKSSSCNINIGKHAEVLEAPDYRSRVSKCGVPDRLKTNHTRGNVFSSYAFRRNGRPSNAIALRSSYSNVAVKSAFVLRNCSCKNQVNSICHFAYADSIVTCQVTLTKFSRQTFTSPTTTSQREVIFTQELFKELTKLIGCEGSWANAQRLIGKWKRTVENTKRKKLHLKGVVQFFAFCNNFLVAKLFFLGWKYLHAF